MTAEKALEILTEQLKKFYARSKLILVLTDGGLTVQNKEQSEESLKPFLEKKLVFVKLGAETEEAEIVRCREFL